MENKTKPSNISVEAFLDTIDSDVRRADAERLIELMSEISGEQPYMWGPSIIGFGTYRYRYASGRTGEAPAIGFSPRKAAISMYVTDGAEDASELLETLGPHTTGKACIYIKKLADIHEPTLKKLIRHGLKISAEIDADFERPASS